MARLLTRLSPFLLSLGAMIYAFLPSAGACPINVMDSTGSTTYTVVSGDTLSSIAAGLGFSWQQLAGWNHMDWAQAQAINPGQVLQLPSPTYVAPEISAPVVAAAPISTYSRSSYSAAPAQSGGSSFEACVIQRESGGNPQITNGAGYWGLVQFSYGTWVASGGNPSDFGHASADEQMQVFHQAISKFGTSPWSPYDHC
jgi:LysM repeat protein